MWPELIGAGISLAGNIFSARDAERGQQEANLANASEADKNRAFQLYMSNTAHQREVKDLREAGLNPILSAKFGGASTPPGSMPVMQSTTSESAGIKAGTAKLLSDVRLTNELAKTEQSKQGLNNAQADSLRGSVTIGGVRVPISAVVDAVESAGKKLNSAKAVFNDVVNTVKRKTVGVARSGAVGLTY